MSTFKEQLTQLHACEEAVAWVDQQTAAQAWQACERGDWMLWLLGRVSGPPDSESRRKLVGIAAECAELALPIYENKHPGDTRVRDCIEGCKRYAAADPEMTLDRLCEVRRRAAAADAARQTVLRQCAEIVRKHYPEPPIKE